MSNKLLFRLAVLVAAMMCALGASAYDFTYGGYYYNILTDSTVAITYRDGNFNSYSGDVTIPEHVYNGSKYYTVTQVGVFAFLNSTRVTSVTIPNTVTYIESRAFENCVELESVVMGKNCSFYNPEEYSYSSQVFKNCPNLLSVTCWRFQPDEWPESGNLNFDQLVLDYAVLRVPRGAIPNYQTTEGWRLFEWYQEISAYFNYDFYYEGVFYKIKNGNAWVTYMDEDYNSYSGTVTIPASVTYNNTTYTVKGIDDYAFRSCGDLTKVEMPLTIDSIGKYAFYYCTKLTEIDIPNGVTYIGDGAFSWCSKLKSLMFPAGVTVINGTTCRGCSALETVWLPVNLTDIYAGAFYNCNAITKIISLSEAPPWMYNKNVFPSTVYDNATLYIPEDAISNGYTSAYGNWQYFTTQKPYNQYLSSEINATGGNITFSTLSTNNYPWLVKTNSYRFCAQSGNTGIHESTSVLTATVTVPYGGTLSFLYKAWGEGTSNAWDACSFFVDGEEKLKLGAYDNVDWETFTVEIPAGTHTLKWRYSKDGSINPEGDYFAIDNVLLEANVPEAYGCYTESNTTLTFYYDTQRSSRTGTTYDLNTGDYSPDWDFDDTYTNVTKVVFDPSFADARPTTTKCWFADMTNLQSITGMSYLNTSEVTNMGWMFGNCTELTSIDLSHFNTSKVTTMGHMFYRCFGLTSLDLSTFNTSQVFGMTQMFRGCGDLRTIYVGNGWSTAAVTYDDWIFYNCTSLVGGQGTTYDRNHTGKEYAHIDGGPSNPGYFTAKNAGLRGDVDSDGNVTIGDVSALIDYLLNGASSGVTESSADVDLDGNVSIGDVSALTDYLLNGFWN